MPKKGGYDWLRKFDRYADPIFLTLNQQKKVKTPCGGGLTLMVMAIVLYWFVEQVLTELGGTFTNNYTLTNLSTTDSTD